MLHESSPLAVSSLADGGRNGRRLQDRIPAGNVRRVVSRVQQVANLFVQSGMNKMRSNFRHRDQNKTAPVKTRVGNGQKRRLETLGAKKQKIEVNRPRL